MQVGRLVGKWLPLAPIVFGQQLDDLFKLLASQTGNFLSHPSIERSRVKFSDKVFGELESLIHMEVWAMPRPIEDALKSWR